MSGVTSGNFEGHLTLDLSFEPLGGDHNTQLSRSHDHERGHYEWDCWRLLSDHSNTSSTSDDQMYIKSLTFLLSLYPHQVRCLLSDS